MKKLQNIKPVGKFARFFIKNYQISIIFLLIIFIGGALGLLKLPKEGMPKVDIPYATINTIYPGATPKDVEDDITAPLENAIKESSNIKEIESSSLEGFSSIVIIFEAKTDVDKNLDSLRAKVDDVRDKLPNEAENPNISKIDASGLSMLVNVVGPYDAVNLSKNTKNLADELEKIEGIKSIEVLGDVERKISIIIDYKKFAQSGITYDQVSGAIKAANISFPGGTFEESEKNIPIQVEAKFKSKEDIEKIVIGQSLNAPVFLKDIAEIKDGYEEKKINLRTGYKKDDLLISNESISLAINTVDNSDLINISNNVQDKINELENNKLDQDIKAIMVYDQADEARQQINDLIRSAWQGLIIIGLVLFIFISLRSSFVIAFVIPLALLFVFLVFSFTDFTLNTITLFSMILTLGILVDTAIVVVEGIQHNLQKGYSHVDAAVKSVSDVGGAIITATLTTILVFIPIAMMGGITGEFIKYIPYTVITVLSGALLIALSITPFLGKSLLKLSKKEKEKIKKEGSAEWKIIKRYISSLKNIISSRWKKAAALLIVILLFSLSMYLPASEKVKVNLWPEEEDMDFFQIAIEYPKGTIDEVKNEVLKDIGRQIEILALEENEVNEALVSYAPLSFYGEFADAGNANSMIVSLTDMRSRDITSSDIIDKLNGKLKGYQKAEIDISNFSMGPPQSEYPVEVQISGDNLDNLKAASADLTKFLRDTEEVKDAKDSAEEEKSSQIQIKVKRDELNKYGLPAIQVAQLVRNIYQPETVGEFFDQESNKNVDIIIEFVAANHNLESIKNITVAKLGPREIKLSEIADVNKIEELKRIDHFDGKRYIEVKASIEENIDANLISKKVSDYFTADKLEEYNLNDDAITFRGEFEEEANAFDDFGEAFVLSLLLIFMVLVFQFKSFLQPLIIMLAIPLSMIGVFFGLYITGSPISFLGLLGIIALAGIVVNDSIVLVDRFNSLRKAGRSLKDAVVEGTRLRTRPVLSTSITTIGGILPLTIAVSFWKPLGIAMISGLIASTILTLLIIPIIYFILTNLTIKIAKRFKRG